MERPENLEDLDEKLDTRIPEIGRPAAGVVEARYPRASHSEEKLTDEPARLAALKAYEVLDTAPEPAFDRITGLVKTILGVPIATVSLVTDDRQWFKSCVGLDINETARDISFCTHTIQARVPLNIPDARLDPRFAENPLVTGPPHIVSYLGIPLVTPDGYNIGSLCAIDTKPRNFDAGQISILENLAALVMGEMELRRIAQVDHLTGVATRRGFTLELERAISRYTRKKRSSALVVLDIDHFKLVNDTHGHPAGDLVLKGVGGKLRSLTRASDFVGRIGGEEFAVLLGDADLMQAVAAAERFRLALEAFVIEHNPPLRITASFGVATLEDDCATVETWFAKADQALYAAKRAGRNRSSVA